jgi:uncharacterized protein (DUF58 family)
MEWQRRVTIAFDQPIEIGPRVITGSVPPARRTRDIGDEDVRGVRPYEPGDTMKSIHWPATARAGSLTVRQLDAPVAPNVVIAVDLNLLSSEANEERASRAAGMARAALDSGAAVILATCELDGPVTAAVTSASAVNRRLARAISGPLALDDRDGVVTP